MPMLISDITALVDILRPGNAYTSAIKLQWLNEVDGSIWYDAYKYISSSVISRLLNIPAYPLPIGVDFNLITNVYVDGDEIFKIDSTFDKTVGYFRGSDGELSIYPVPTASDVTPGITISYVTPFLKHALETESVYAESPYERMYYEYLIAKMDFYSKDFPSFNNGMTTFNNTLKEYTAWWGSRNPFERNVR